jgi:Skp family chaperone for outer membrane proteins
MDDSMWGLAEPHDLLQAVVPEPANTTTTTAILPVSFEQEEQQHTIRFKRKREELELLKMESDIYANKKKLDEASKLLSYNRMKETIAELKLVNDPVRCKLNDRTRAMIQEVLQRSLLESHLWSD